MYYQLEVQMRKVILRMNELEKYEKIKDLVDHNGNKKHVALKLGLSVRQVERLVKKYKENGKSRVRAWESLQTTSKDLR